MKYEFARLYYGVNRSFMDIMNGDPKRIEFDAFESSFELMGKISAEGWRIVHVAEHIAEFRYEVWLQREVMPRLTIRKVESAANAD